MRRHRPRRWVRISPLVALDLLRKIERQRAQPTPFLFDELSKALDSHVRAELTRRRR